MTQPLLSICIPTYNRAYYLDQCLEAIVHQDGFDERVEVVISDNASTDNTQELCKKYTEQYPNIRYFRNEVMGPNLHPVLQRATGLLRKVTNDTILYQPGAIEYMLQAIEENKEKKRQVYFLNTGRYKAPIKTESLDTFITALGFRITWFGSVSCWDEDCEDLSIIINDRTSALPQVPYLLGLFEKHGGGVVYDRPIMKVQPVEMKRVSYGPDRIWGIHKIFYTNFLGFIQQYVDSGKISKESYEQVRKELLLNFLCGWVANWEINRDKYLFCETENLKEAVENSYKNDSYFWLYKLKLVYTKCKVIARKILKA